VLSVEASARQESGANARIKRAGFAQVKTIEEFDFTMFRTSFLKRVGDDREAGW
jgi:hypothetical protein